MSVKVQVIFYSMYGHIYRMAEAVAEGAREVEGAEVGLFQVAELIPEEMLERIGARAARAAFGDLGKLTATVGAYANRQFFHYLNLPLALTLSDKDFQARRLNVKFKDEDGKIVGGLANYKISDDGKTYDFILKDGLHWSDGAAITSDDAIYTIKTIRGNRLN